MEGEVDGGGEEGSDGAVEEEEVAFDRPLTRMERECGAWVGLHEKRQREQREALRRDVAA